MSPIKNYVSRVVKLQASRGEDQRCADCKSQEPRWASHNLGIFICLNCSGIHRSLGTHISKVKSLDLDTWTKDQAKTMKEIGNKKANQYWEGSLPTDFQPDLSSLEPWIKQKYIEKAFVKTDQNTSLPPSPEGGLPTKTNSQTNNSPTQPLDYFDTSTSHPITKLKGAEYFPLGREL